MLLGSYSKSSQYVGDNCYCLLDFGRSLHAKNSMRMRGNYHKRSLACLEQCRRFSNETWIMSK